MEYILYARHFQALRRQKEVGKSVLVEDRAQQWRQASIQRNTQINVNYIVVRP